jgi:hypothetical protein
MADYGTMVLLTAPAVLELAGYAPATALIDYGAMTIIPPAAPVPIDAYNIGGTTPCPPIPGPPTTGQIWPRGQGN